MGFGDFLTTILSGGLSNKNFRNGASDFLMGQDSQMQPYNQDALQMLMQMLQGGGGLENNQGFQGGSNFLNNLFSNNQEQMDQFQRPYMENFNERIAPGIAERFAGMGTGGGASSSSGLQNSLAQAGRGLQSDLAAMRGNMQMQGLGSALNYAQQPIQNRLNAAQSIPGQYYERPGQGGLLQSFAQGAGQGIGKLGASWLGG